MDTSEMSAMTSTGMGMGTSSSGSTGMGMMMMPMHMFVYFSTNCAFVFKPWRTQLGDNGMFVLGCFLCLFYAFFHACIPAMKKKHMEILIKRRSLSLTEKPPLVIRMVLAFYYFLYAFSNIILMMIMMTMDGYVLLSLAVGLTIGFFIFNGLKRNKKTSSCH